MPIIFSKLYLFLSFAAFALACDDDRNGFFPATNGVLRSCVWLAARPSEMLTLCIPSDPSGAYDVCEETCGKCVDDCTEDSRAKFEVAGAIRDCGWLSLRNSMQDLLCVEGTLPYAQCPETCNVCDGQVPVPAPTTTSPPTFAVTGSPPSSAPSDVAATTAPITFPPTAFLPTTQRPTTAPTSFPYTPPPVDAGMFCDDERYTQFYVADIGQWQRCVWLAARRDFIDVLCSPSDLSGAYDICAETCGKCADSCAENSRAKFDVNGIIRDCMWLSLRFDMQDMLCFPGSTAFSQCPETCNACDGKMQSATPAPTPLPVMMTSAPTTNSPTSPAPTTAPTPAIVTPGPTGAPTPAPMVILTPLPTIDPTPNPTTLATTRGPTLFPTKMPTLPQTPAPTLPTRGPTLFPTKMPTLPQTPAPTLPKTPAPTRNPADLTVGAYYYPWHADDFHRGSPYLRDELSPKQRPVLGEYDDRDPAVIAQHLRWSRQANIQLWVTSWWGPGSREDDATLKTILPHTDLGTHKIALFYETTGRIRSKTNYTTEAVAPDMVHMCKNYFSHPNYFKINGRPVIFMYVSRRYSQLRLLEGILLLMRKAAADYGFNPYIIGDQVFRAAPTGVYPPFKQLDAVTNYDVRGGMIVPVGTNYITQVEVDNFYIEQAKWKAAASKEGCAFVPPAVPGYNDRAVRLEAGNAAVSRRLTPQDVEGSLFRATLKGARKLADATINNLVMINSFNEWHEDTQIEPTVGGNKTVTPFNLTQGIEYEAYGELYLNILREETV